MTEIRTLCWVTKEGQKQVQQIDLLMHPPFVSCFLRVLARPLCHMPAFHFSLPSSHHLVKEMVFTVKEMVVTVILLLV